MKAKKQESDTIDMLWLGVILPEDQIEECNDVLNELLKVKSVQVTGPSKMVGEMSVVKFTVADEDIPTVMISRLGCDAKWASDYPEYDRAFSE